MRITRESGQGAVVHYFMKYRFIMVEYCTGFGKGKAALDSIRKLNNEMGIRTKGIIATHNTRGRDDLWPGEIKQWYPHLERDHDVAIECYNSLKNYKAISFDWAIMDEAHYITLTNAGFFEVNRFGAILLMTGTLPDDPVKQSILKRISKQRILTITLDEAIANSVLNDYRVIIWEIELTPSEWSGYLEICKRIDFFVNKCNEFAARTARGERMRYIYNLESKYQAGCYIRDQLRAAGRRFAIFTGSIEIADRISPYCLYGGRGIHDYTKFANGEVNEIASIKMLQEGENIKGLQAGLMQQINGKQLNFMQKLGRFMRMPVGEIARIHIIVAKQTYDYTWSVKALAGIDKTKVTRMQLSGDKYLHYQ